MSDTLSRLRTALADRYRVERELGAGGMATVYLAHDLKHEREVAIKVLHPDLGAALGGERFLAEIKTTAKLQHPHILPLLDSGVADTLLYYVMPYVRGETLRARLDRERQLPVDDAVRLAREVAGALDHAHRQGIIHRDIKPENILLQEGSALVADFGIALAVQSAGGQRMTQTGLSLGTPQYMSPEQAMGERAIDARSDIYALGAVTYEMLTGEPPFVGATVQAIVAKIMNADPDPITLTRRSVPAHVDHAVQRALAKLPADRVASAALFAEALGKSDAQPMAVTPARRRRPLGTTLLLVTLSAAVGAAALWMSTRMAGSNGSTADESFELAQVTFDGQSGAPALRAAGDGLAFVRTACEQPGHFGFTSDDRSVADEMPCVSTLFVQDTGATNAVAILQNASLISDVRWLASGAGVVINAILDSARAGLFVVPRLGGAPRRIGSAMLFDTHPAGDTVFALHASANDTYWAQVIPVNSGQVVDSIPVGTIAPIGLAISPDGRRFAVQSNQIVLRERNGDAIDSIVQRQSRGSIRWSPDGRSLLTFYGNVGRIDPFVRIDISGDGHFTGQIVRLMPPVQTLYTGRFDVARKTGQVVFMLGNWQQDLATFSVSENAVGEPVGIAGGSAWISPPLLSPNGSTLYFIKTDALGDNLYARRVGDEMADDGVSVSRGAGTFSGGWISSTGSRVHFVKADVDSSWVVSFDPVKRESQSHRLPPSSPVGNRITVITGGRYLNNSRDRRALLRSNAALTTLDTLVALPDTLQTVDHEVNAAGDSVAVVLLRPRGATLVVSPVSTWAPRVLASWPRDMGSTRLSWTRDGFIYLWTWEPGSRAPGLGQVAANGSSPLRIIQSLPARCASSALTIAVTAPVGACMLEDVRSDIFVGFVPGIGR